MIRWPNSGEAAGMQKRLPEVHRHDAFMEKQMEFRTDAEE